MSITVSADVLNLTLGVLDAESELNIPVDSTSMDIFVSDYEQIRTPLFQNYNGRYSMGNASNLQHGWVTKCTSAYDRERRLFDKLLTESYNHHGVCMTFYVTSYNSSYDDIWGEDLDRFIERKFKVMAFYELPREEKMWSKFGIEGMDEFSMFVSKMHFNEASTYGMSEVAGNRGKGTYPAHIPKIGDMIVSKYNKYIYEIVEVKEEVGMYLLSKQHVWEFIVRPFKDQSISLSATTSAAMNFIGDYTDTNTDIMDNTNTVNTIVPDIKYSPPANEKDANDPFSNW